MVPATSGPQLGLGGEGLLAHGPHPRLACGGGGAGVLAARGLRLRDFVPRSSAHCGRLACRVEVETLPLPPQFLGLAVLGAASVFVAGCCCGLVCASVVPPAFSGALRLQPAALSAPSTKRLALYG